MRKIEKVAMIFFPINNAGGIVTWNKEIQKGLRRNGVEPTFFYATPTNRFTCDSENDVKKLDDYQLAGHHLSYTMQNIADSIETLNKFDAIIFCKNSPHPTKDNLGRADIENWKLLYTEPTPPKVVIYHDANWEKTNPWAADVADYIDICVSSQKKFSHSVERFPADCVKYWDYFPIDFEPIDKLKLNRKQEIGMLATQWIGWKNHDKLFKQIDKVEVPINMFGVGIEYHYIKKTDEFLNNIKEDWRMSKINFQDDPNFDKSEIIVHNPNAIHNMYGHVPFELLQKYYAKSLFSIDLSTRGYTNYTHFEPLCYRTISMIERNVFEDPDNVIPEDCCVQFELENVAEYINWFKGEKDSLELKQIQDNGQKFARKMDTTKVALRLINALKNL